MHTKMIKKFIEEHKGEIFDAGYLYERLFQVIPNKTYLKIIERFVDSTSLVRISKGVYLIGESKAVVDPILEFYTSNYSGMIIGNRMLYDLGIVDYSSDEIELLTSRITTSTKNIKNYKLRYLNMFFIPETIAVIQGLECIAAIPKLDKYNANKFFLVIEKMIRSYQDYGFESIIKNIKYDFSTIEALAKILNEQNVPNKVIAIYEESTK
ncbi:MAG: hypothetical protein WC193_05475 [Bacilli bacterium]